jgi:hypothetical protein
MESTDSDEQFRQAEQETLDEQADTVQADPQEEEAKLELD